MQAEVFVQKLRENTPSKKLLISDGLSNEEANRIIEGYFVLSKNSFQNKYKDELLRLVNNFDASHIDVSSISFCKELKENEKFYFVGNYEVDLLVIDKITEQVQIYEYDAPEHLLWNCAANGSKFIEAILHAVPFSTQCMFDDKLWNDKEVTIEVALQCTEIAGGKNYEDFFKVYLGCW